MGQVMTNEITFERLFQFHRPHMTGDGHQFAQVDFRISTAASVTDMVDAFEAFLLACGYHPKNVEEALGR